MGWFKTFKRVGLAYATGGLSEVAKAAQDAMAPGDISIGTESTAETDAIIEETEEEKKRKLQAAEELNPTGSLGTGNPTIKRTNLLGS